MGKSTEFGPEMTELKHADAAARGTRHASRAAATANPCEVTISKFSARAERSCDIRLHFRESRVAATEK